MRKSKAFTLVEILVVILIIGLLFVFLVPKISSSTTKAKEVGVKNDFHSFETAMESLAKENSGLGSSDGLTATNVVSKLNEYLDQALKFQEGTADATGTILSNKKDPWNNPYRLVYLPASSSSNGGLMVLSGGKDGNYQYTGSISSIDTVASATGSTDAERVQNKVSEATGTTDDYLIGCFFLNGTTYTASNGFSSNINTTGGTASSTGSSAGSGSSSTPAPSSEEMFTWEGTSITGLSSDGDSQESLVIPAKATQIYFDAFGFKNNLKSVTIPGNVRLIYPNAFNYCSNLKSVSLGNGVQALGSGAFKSCTSLESISIPGSVTEIESDAFSECTALKSVTFGSGLQKIGSCAFQGAAIESVTIPEGVTTIDMGAFNKTKLKSVTIPDSVTSMGYYVFDGCTELTSISAPASLRSTEAEWMGSCTATVTYR